MTENKRCRDGTYLVGFAFREKEKGVGEINKWKDKTYQAVLRQVSVRNVCACIYILKIQLT